MLDDLLVVQDERACVGLADEGAAVQPQQDFLPRLAAGVLDVARAEAGHPVAEVTQRLQVEIVNEVAALDQAVAGGDAQFLAPEGETLARDLPRQAHEHVAAHENGHAQAHAGQVVPVAPRVAPVEFTAVGFHVVVGPDGPVGLP